MTSGLNTTPIVFTGPLDAEVTRDLHRLYCRRHPFFPIAYGLMAVAMLTLSFFPARSMEWWDRAFFVAAAVVLALIAFGLPQWSWRLWWPRFAREMEDHVRGEITATGIRWVVDGEELPWSLFMAGKVDPDGALLYVSPSEALPLHRSFFASEAEWKRAVEYVRSSVRSFRAWSR